MARRGRGRPRDYETIQRIVRLREQKISYREIARMIDRRHSWVYEAYQRYIREKRTGDLAKPPTDVWVESEELERKIVISVSCPATGALVCSAPPDQVVVGFEVGVWVFDEKKGQEESKAGEPDRCIFTEIEETTGRVPFETLHRSHVPRWLRIRTVGPEGSRSRWAPEAGMLMKPWQGSRGIPMVTLSFERGEDEHHVLQ